MASAQRILPFSYSTLLTLAALLALMAAPRAHATSFEDITLEQLAARSDIVAIGTVIAAEAFASGPSGQSGIHTRVQLAVEEMVVGTPISIVEFWVHGGQLGDRMRVMRGQARFEVDEEVAVFLFAAPDGSLWPQGMARGRWEIVHAGNRTVVTPGASLVAGQKGRIRIEGGSPSGSEVFVPDGAVDRSAFARRVRDARGVR